MRNHRLVIVAVLAICVALPGISIAKNTANTGETDWQLASGPPQSDPRIVNLVRWSKRDGGNNHWYAIIASEMYWEDAKALAEATKFRGKYGYLATITSAEENDFIQNHVVAGTHQPSVMDMFWLGGHYVEGTWGWTTGEPFSYVNWAPTEPNNVGIETVLGFWGPNTVDWRRTPGTWNNSLPNGDISPLAKFWGIVEWGRPEGTAAKTAAMDGLVPTGLSLKQNFPNPFNPVTEIQFTLAESRYVRLQVVNVAGQVVATLLNDEREAGHHSVTWYGTSDAGVPVASGVYFYRISAGDFVQTKRMTLLR